MVNAVAMEILMVSAELAPYLAGNSTGDGDPTLQAAGVSALSRALVELGHSVTLAVPNGKGFADAGLMFARRLTPLTLPTGEEVTVLDGQLPSGVKVTLFESKSLESRQGAYGEDGKDYPDNRLRFGTLCQAAAALALQAAEKGQPFDVVHAHGWGASAMPVVTKLPTLLTVYDASQQGSMTLKELDAFGIPVDKDVRQSYRLGNRGNALKGGMVTAKLVTTVSQTYAEELLTKEVSGALGTALEQADVAVVGIPPGIDYAVFNPSTDAALNTRFDAESPALKGLCKTEFLKEAGLELHPERPLVVFADSLGKSTGAALVAASAVSIIESGAQLVVVGTGSKSLEKQFDSARLRKTPGFKFINSAVPAQRRRALAAADIALCPSVVPSASEAILAAQRYGAVPVAFASAAARDAVVDCAQDLQTGTGFLFDDATGDALVGAVARALSASSSSAWGRLRCRVMRLDLGWERAARRYGQLFRVISGKKKAA